MPRHAIERWIRAPCGCAVAAADTLADAPPRHRALDTGKGKKGKDQLAVATDTEGVYKPQLR